MNLGGVYVDSGRSTLRPMPGESVARRRDCSEPTAREVEFATGILESHRDALAECAERLLEKETLSGDELPVLSAETSST